MREGSAQLRPPPMNAAPNGSDLDVENLTDLLIAEALDVAQHNGRTKFWW
jgi:hypothetical protein